MEIYGESLVSLKYRPKDWLRLRMAGQLLFRMTMIRDSLEDPFFSRVNRNEVEPRFQDTYVMFSRSWLDLAVGMLTTVWGNTDLINPNDILTAKDHVCLRRRARRQRVIDRLANESGKRTIGGKGLVHALLKGL